MKDTSSIGVERSGTLNTPLKRLLVVITIICFLGFFILISTAKADPYINAVRMLQGSTERGNNLFKMNCVGCHGISAQGLVGPDLHKVTYNLSDSKIINQVRNGLTPPMPSFEIDSQSMADILSYLHSIEEL